MHGGELVVQQLRREGIEVVFTLSGGHTAHAFEACDRLGVRLIDVRHEAAAAHMAEAHGRLTRTPGVCLVTAGPGFTNCLTGVQNARMAASPMVVVSGRAGISQEGRLALQDMNQIDVIRPMTKWAATVHQIERVPEYVSTAFRHARQGQPGPTYVEIPLELMAGEVDAEQVRFPETNRGIRPAACDEGAVREALELLGRAERPVIVAGSGAHYAGAGPALQTLIERTGVPLFTLNAGRGVVPDTHPNCFGNALAFVIGAAPVGVPTADAVLLLGTRLSMYFGYGRPPMMSPQATLIEVDVEATEIGRNRDAALGIPGDARSFCELALDVLDRAKITFSLESWQRDLTKDLPKIFATYDHYLKSDQIPVHPLRLCREIDEFLGEEGILIADGGDTQAWMPMVRKVYRSGSYMDAGPFGCLGVGLPFALAAKALHPEETVVLFNGDGSMGFNFMEFDTAIRHRLPIIVVVNNDLAWGMIKHGNEITFGKDNLQGSELGLVRYDRMVQAMGGYGELIRDPADIAGALGRAREQNVPACLNVVTDTTAVSPGTTSLTLLFIEAMRDFAQ
jgi:acetolactate synthase-1/2/3 large subunit